MERERLLGEARGVDPELEDFVRRLLAVDGQPTQSEQQPLAAIAAVLESGNAWIGREIGQYRIVRELGVGGMGRVFEALQRSPARAVALKVMRRWIATPAVLERFAFEAEILGRLCHPGIAQVHEAGTIRDGDEEIPWFAMELVADARPMDAYARERGLDLRERLRMMAQVCDAVHHGHVRGIVHRDLKPANVLVDAEGRPKVIDFGIAKSIDSDRAVTLRTEVGAILGTLQYMSPEQCDGDPRSVDAQSDVYSLGVLLYELVCERSPYDIARKPLSYALHVVREHDPARPSSIRRALRGDLEAVLLRAIEKVPARRYASAAALADDLRRFLEGRPVEARAPSAWERLWRWVGRNPVAGTAAACGLLVAMTGGVLVGGLHVLGRAPERMFLAPDGSFARLESRAGLGLAQWDAGGPSSICFAQLTRLPPELGGGEVAVIGATEAATWRHGAELCVFDPRAPDEPLWSTAEHPLDPPPGLPARPEARFCCGGVLLEDALEETPGRELVIVHRSSVYSEATIRIFDLAGRLLYQAWNDGAIFELSWLPGARRLVVAALDSEKRWDELGYELADLEAQYPAVVFALAPKAGRIGRNDWIVRGGEVRDESLAWYRWLGPVEALAAYGSAVPALESEAGTFDRRSHLRCYFRRTSDRRRSPEGGLHFLLDGAGEVVARYADDGYKHALQSGWLPPPETYQLLPYDRMPR